MKREEAETAANGICHPLPGTDPYAGSPPSLRDRIADAILSAYRSGAEEMRGRCAQAVTRIADKQKHPYAVGVCVVISTEIAFLPATEDDEQGESDELPV